MSKPSVCEEQTFDRLHSEHGTSLRNFLFYKFGDLEKAKDFTQEAFVRLWQNCSKVALEKAKSYLFTIANRLFLDYTDHQKVVLKFQRLENKREAQFESNPEYLYRVEEFKERLEEAISTIPEKQRTVFLMSRIDKMANKDIAETLGVSIKTVEKHITSTLKELKEKLDEVTRFRI